MNRPMLYQIRVRGHLSDRRAAWFDGLTIENRPGGEAVLSGPWPTRRRCTVCSGPDTRPGASLWAAAWKMRAMELTVSDPIAGG
jgi:hypothetical protein